MTFNVEIIKSYSSVTFNPNSDRSGDLGVDRKLNYKYFVMVIKASKHNKVLRSKYFLPKIRKLTVVSLNFLGEDIGTRTIFATIWQC